MSSRTKPRPLAAATLAAALAFAAGVALTAAVGGAHAAPEPAFDRHLAERLVRAQEQQTRALDALTRAAERCAR